MSSSASRSACSANPSELNSFSASRTLLLISFSFVRKFRCCSSFLRSTAVCFITAALRSRAEFSDFGFFEFSSSFRRLLQESRSRRFICFETVPAYYAAATERIRVARAALEGGEKGV